MSIAKWPSLRWACVGALISLVGCSGNRPMPKEFGQLYPVEGKVTFDGKPLRGGNVTFFSLDRDVKMLQPMGLIDAQGHYSLATSGEAGAPVGKYRATVEPASDDKAQDMLVDVRYTSWVNSPLLVEVRENAPAGAYDLKLALPKKR